MDNKGSIESNRAQENYHKWLGTKSHDDLEQYRECKRNVKKLVKACKNGTWEKMCGEIDHELGYSRSAQAKRLLRKMRRTKNPSTVLQLIQGVKKLRLQRFRDDRGGKNKHVFYLTKLWLMHRFAAR